LVAALEVGKMGMNDKTVAEMTALQLKALIQSAIKEALQEILGDPDVGLDLRSGFEQRLRQEMDYVSSGGCLLSLKELTDQLEGNSGV